MSLHEYCPSISCLATGCERQDPIWQNSGSTCSKLKILANLLHCSARSKHYMNSLVNSDLQHAEISLNAYIKHASCSFFKYFQKMPAVRHIGNGNTVNTG